MSFCTKCGKEIAEGGKFCTSCGTAVNSQAAGSAQVTVTTALGNQNNTAQPQVIVYNQPTPGISPSWPVKNKIAAGLLGIFLGGLGVHKFYLGKVGMGIVYVLFCWTAIPALIGFIEGIVYLCSSDENFQLTHHVRLE